MRPCTGVQQCPAPHKLIRCCLQHHTGSHFHQVCDWLQSSPLLTDRSGRKPYTRSILVLGTVRPGGYSGSDLVTRGRRVMFWVMTGKCILHDPPRQLNNYNSRVGGTRKVGVIIFPLVGYHNTHPVQLPRQRRFVPSFSSAIARNGEGAVIWPADDNRQAGSATVKWEATTIKIPPN